MSVSYDKCGALYGSVVGAWKRDKKDLVPLKVHLVVKDPDGHELSQWKMFCLTHKQKDGSMISLAAQQVVDEFETLSRSELESSELIDEDEIYHKVVGKERHGRVHGYKLTDKRANPCRLEFLDKLTEANKLNEKMLTKIKELEKKNR
ncbi:hypothetical protein CRYUN_Cryun12cG0137700 [Craigia yunnanensis]